MRSFIVLYTITLLCFLINLNAQNEVKNEKSKQLFELETKYQTEKKEKEILSLVVEKKKKNTYIILAISLISMVSVSGIYTVFQHRSKRIIAELTTKIREQRISELENERQLLATQSVLKGEDAERTRLARDLLDGLGGLLSGVKLALTNLKGNYIITPEKVTRFDHALNLLDSSIKDMRRISHNIMPEALINFGLKDSLQDFCSKVDTKKCAIKFFYYGDTNRLEQTAETSLYRITQELINNAIKYAEASEIIIQLVKEKNRIYLTVQDNGKGFDPLKIDILKLSGIQNIKARVESFKGRMDIDSAPGKGTEIGIEFLIG